MRCQACGTEIASSRLSCPGCHRLVHADGLRQLADVAQAASDEGRIRDAITAWRQALELLPPGTNQHQRVASRIDALSSDLDRQPATQAAPESSAEKPESGKRAPWAKVGAGLGATGLLLWKLKAVVIFIFTKAKFFLLGLTKASTLFSMLLSLGVYWAAFGWKFGLGLVISIYVHEMGHVAALSYLGIRASAPMFIPGLGAAIRLSQYPASPREDARVGLAGPLWGLGAATVAYVLFLALGWPIWGAIARVGAWINLFNLLPVWQLDGARGFAAMSRPQRFLAAAALAVMFFFTGEGMLILLAIVAFVRLGGADQNPQGDKQACFWYIFLVVALAVMCTLEVPMGDA